MAEAGADGRTDVCLGQLFSADVNGTGSVGVSSSDGADHLRAAREAYAEAGIPGNRTRTISGRAAEVLPRLTDAAYDMVFIDADKPSFPLYVTQAVRLLKRGGLLVVNDALDHGKVADPAVREATTNTMRKVGKAIRENEDLASALLPTGDGLLLAVKTA